MKNNKENGTYVMDIKNKYPLHSIFYKSWDMSDTLCCQLYKPQLKKTTSFPHFGVFWWMQQFLEDHNSFVGEFLV